MEQLIPMNLQLFAENAEQSEVNGTEPDNNTEQGDVSFDELLKNKNNQAEFDRRISKALETARLKWQKETEAKVSEAKTEAEKLAKMNAEEKAAHERQKPLTGLKRNWRDSARKYRLQKL